ncbi:hypothetical protein ACGF7W_29480 [Streptomyces sp. NPDC048219]|uniref:hypothetical protein n=1 Tax=Streptomyces sp. NPDC048219 TaxID=3365517 RepID=UPI00371B6A7A
MADWKRTMIDIGDKPLYGEHRGGPMGFQVMSNLTRTGDYDDRFLNSYGTKLMATERKLTGNGEHPNMAWRQGPGNPGRRKHLQGQGVALPLPVPRRGTGLARGVECAPELVIDI